MYFCVGGSRVKIDCASLIVLNEGIETDRKANGLRRTPMRSDCSFSTDSALSSLANFYKFITSRKWFGCFLGVYRVFYRSFQRTILLTFRMAVGWIYLVVSLGVMLVVLINEVNRRFSITSCLVVIRYTNFVTVL